MDEAVNAIAAVLKDHRYDSMSQDSGQQCVCGSDSRFAQYLDGEPLADPPWKTIDHHRAQLVVRALRGMVATL